MEEGRKQAEKGRGWGTEDVMSLAFVSPLSAHIYVFTMKYVIDLLCQGIFFLLQHAQGKVFC